MWIEELTIENIKCFDKTTIRFGTGKAPYPWVTLLGENGGGKSTVLQALGLLLAGPEGADQLLKRPEGWLRDEARGGKVTVCIHKDKNDPGNFGVEKARNKFTYSYWITGSKRLEIESGKVKKIYTDPSIIENTDKILTWLRENALLPKGKGWFGAGYGAFRRLTRKGGQINLPSMQNPIRYSNFLTQFEEDQPLTAFEQWLVSLDYRVLKNGESGKTAARQRELGIAAINKLLPEGSAFESVDEDGRIWFRVNEARVSTLALSDGYRSILALAGDLVWRLIEAFPDSKDPLKEKGVVLIDELDIHLHPTWQRQIPQWLRTVFPNIQFIVATHSPLIAAGAGKDAKTYRLSQDGDGNITVLEIENIAFKGVDAILQSEAFGLVSTYSPEAEETMQTYLRLKGKHSPSQEEKQELSQIKPLVREIFDSSDQRMDEEEAAFRQEVIAYLKKNKPG
jgi:predicted ATP-binding protein involved in virulence